MNESTSFPEATKAPQHELKAWNAPVITEIELAQTRMTGTNNADGSADSNNAAS